MNSLSRIIVLMMFVLFATVAVRAQDESTSTPLRPSTKLDEGLRADEQLVQQMEQLRRQLELHGLALDRLMDADDGSVEVGVKINLVQMLLQYDRAKLLATAAPAAARHGWHLQVDINRKQTLAQRRQLDTQLTQNRIEELADKIVSSEQQFKLVSDASSSRAVAAEIAGLKGELDELINQRAERQADAVKYLDQVAHYEAEQQQMAMWQQQFDALARQMAVRTERLRDAVEHQTQGGVSDEVKQDREAVRKAIDLLRNMPSGDRWQPRRDHPGEPPDVDAGQAVQRQVPQPQPPSPQLEEELEKARRRMTAAQ